MCVLRGKNQTANVTCLIQLSDGRIAAGRSNGTVDVWDCIHGTVVSVEAIENAGITAIGELDDGVLVIGTTNGVVVHWHSKSEPSACWMAQGVVIWTLASLPGGVVAVGFDDGQVVLASVKNV